MTKPLTRRETEAILNYIYGLERIADNEGYNKHFTSTVENAIWHAQEFIRTPKELKPKKMKA